MVALNLIILAILTWKSWAMMAQPDVVFGLAQHYELPHQRALWELTGRNLAMMVIGLWALVHPGRFTYGAVFLMGLIRESADMVFASGLMPGDLGTPHPEALSFLIFLIPYGIALRRLSQGT